VYQEITSKKGHAKNKTDASSIVETINNNLSTLLGVTCHLFPLPMSENGYQIATANGLSQRYEKLKEYAKQLRELGLSVFVEQPQKLFGGIQPKLIITMPLADILEKSDKVAIGLTM